MPVRRSLLAGLEMYCILCRALDKVAIQESLEIQVSGSGCGKSQLPTVLSYFNSSLIFPSFCTFKIYKNVLKRKV